MSPFTFRKSFKVFPGVRINLNKGSTSVTVGTRNVHRTWSSTGRRTTSVNLPGPLGYRKTRSRRSR